MPDTATNGAGATHGVRIGRGVVTHFGSQPITSRAMAERVWRLIQETTGEQGEIVDVLAQLDMTDADAKAVRGSDA